jgi:predicted nucleic acid-binding protein
LINPIVYAEWVPAFSSVDALDGAIADMELIYAELPRAALFLGGKAFLQYRKQGGNKQNVLPDFFIGAHAVALNISVLTRDTRRYSSYFPTVGLISP